MINQIEFIDRNFDPNNPFHCAVKQFGYSTYAQVILIATIDHQDAITKCKPITSITLSISKKALELFNNNDFMNGLRLQNELGL